MTLAQHKAAQTAVRSVRPKAIFAMIEQRFPDHNTPFRSIIPPTEIGGATLLEGALLASLVRLSGAKHIFEFGTFKGATTLLLAENSDDDAQIVTLDLGEDAPMTFNARNTAAEASRDNDHYLRLTRTAHGAPYIERASPEMRAKILQTFGDSHGLDIDTRQYRGAFDLIFIDGGHDRETVINDTQKALAMASENAVIAWHDYGSSVHGDVTAYVDELSFTLPIVHVEASMLAVHWKGLAHLFAA
jgi:predicted O-methyltransferase YrrM